MSDEYPIPRLEQFDSYERACQEFRLLLPDRFNIAGAISRRHSDAVTRIALVEVREAANNTYTFGGLNFLSDKFAVVLNDSGIKRGDRVAVILPQSAALAVAHLGALKLGAAVVSLSPSFSSVTIEYAIRDSEAKALVVDASVRNKLYEIKSNLPSLAHIFVVAEDTVTDRNDRDFWRETYFASSDIATVETDTKVAAFIFYAPTAKAGIVHSHASLIGRLTAFEMSNNLSLGDDAVFWTPSYWASSSSLLDMLYPAWYYGQSVVAQARQVSNVEDALSLIERCEVTNAFISSDDLQTLRRSGPGNEHESKLRVVSSAGRPLEASLREWAKDIFGCPINFGYATDEAGTITVNCERWYPARADSAGRAAPGRRIEILDEDGRVLPSGQKGRIAISRPDAALFLEYLNDPQLTADAFAVEWFLTGDYGFKDEDGYLYIE